MIQQKHDHSESKFPKTDAKILSKSEKTKSTPPIPPPAPPDSKDSKRANKTTKLFWKEVSQQGHPTIWDEMRPSQVDKDFILHFFERPTKGQPETNNFQNGIKMAKVINVLDQKRSNFINIGMTRLPPLNLLTMEALSLHTEIMSKESIEKLLKMLPTAEEISRIQEAQNREPNLPLGTAEQFLLTLSSMDGLDSLLGLWIFKLDLELLDKDVKRPLMDLKSGLESVRKSETFKSILNMFLTVGNFLNESNIKGFLLDYLEKASDVKDTFQKHSLLYHSTYWIMKEDPNNDCDLHKELETFIKMSRVNFDEVNKTLSQIKTLGKSARKYLDELCMKGRLFMIQSQINDFEMQMNRFLDEANEEISKVDVLYKRIFHKEYEEFLLWLGISQNAFNEYKVSV